VTNHYLCRTEELNAQVGAFYTVTAELAQEQARAAEKAGTDRFTCAGKDPAAAEAGSRARLEELGATLLEPEWRGVDNPHLVKCREGHLTRPAPTNARQGHGICRFCAGSEWDVFYIVTGSGIVKFGITTGTATTVSPSTPPRGSPTSSTWQPTSPAQSHSTPRTPSRPLWPTAGEIPVRGREYFEISCLALILDVASSWLTPADRAKAPREWVQGMLFAA
jgi:hypothetical protein